MGKYLFHNGLQISALFDILFKRRIADIKCQLYEKLWVQGHNVGVMSVSLL